MAQSSPAFDAPPSARTQGTLFRVRWVVWLLVIPAVWVAGGGETVSPGVWAWLAVIAIYNLLVGAITRLLPNTSPRFPVVTLVFDTLLFGLLPHLVDPNLSLAVLLSVFPTLVAAVCFGPSAAMLVAGLVFIPIEWPAILTVVKDRNLVALGIGLPTATLLVLTVLAGYLAREERNLAVRKAATELEDLRRAMDGAKLLYLTTNALSSTTSYTPILEAMIAAGLQGLPSSRREDGLPAGLALFFDDTDPKRGLRVVASRYLDRRDLAQRIPGKNGIVGQALQTGRPVLFGDLTGDPELRVFVSLGRCHSGVCYPLQAGLEQYGVVLFAGVAPGRPSEHHLELMQAFTNQAAIAFQNAKLYEDLRIEHEQIIRSENEMRQNLARDLHDGPTQKVAALVMQLDYIHRLADRDLAETKRELVKARGVAMQTIKEIRTTLFTLRPLVLETKGLSAALEQYGARLREGENVPIQVDPGHLGGDLNPNVAATVFAIVDEAVNNARKHAAGKPIYVQAGVDRGALVAVVRDQGPGFDVDKVVRTYDERSSLGLQNMRERARLIDAELRIESAVGRGTTVTLIVPMPQLQFAEAKS